MRITPRSGGAELRLSSAESELLSTLIADTVDALAPDRLDPADPVRQRLYPNGYPDDPEAQVAFRELTESALRDERVERAEQCLADLVSARVRRRFIEVELAADGSQRWARVLNDVRLALGTRLGVTEDDDRRLDPDDPQAGPRLAYAWLSAVQDGLVHALMQ